MKYYTKKKDNYQKFSEQLIHSIVWTKHFSVTSLWCIKESFKGSMTNHPRYSDSELFIYLQSRISFYDTKICEGNFTSVASKCNFTVNQCSRSNIL